MGKNTPLRKDWFMLGLVLGAGASAVKSLMNYGLQEVGVPTMPYSSMASAMAFSRRRRMAGLMGSGVRSKWERAIGHAADIAFGGMMGVAIAYIFTKTPPGNETLKGAATGAGISAATLVLDKTLNLDAVSGVQPKQVATFMTMSALFGALEGAVFGRYGSRLIAESHPQPVQVVTRRSFNRGRLAVR